jgi:hypothetical protein
LIGFLASNLPLVAAQKLEFYVQRKFDPPMSIPKPRNSFFESAEMKAAYERVTERVINVLLTKLTSNCFKREMSILAILEEKNAALKRKQADNSKLKITDDSCPGIAISNTNRKISINKAAFNY